MLTSVQTVMARWRFRSQRAAYYEYLAMLMTQLEGRKTLRDIFEDDARRYGRRTLRGQLSARWARRHEDWGGDIAETFSGSLPRDDVALLRAAQLSGAGALAALLHDLARFARLHDRTRRVLRSTMAAAWLAWVIVLMMLAALPTYTVPALLQPFHSVPPEFHGPVTQRLVSVAALLERYLIPFLATALLFALLVWWSMPNLTGRVRQALDRIGVWRMYRDLQSVRFLSLLGVTVRQRGNVGARLRDAVMSQLAGATRWKSWHLHRMLERIDDGVVGAETFRTGLLDEPTCWYLADVIAAHGVDEGLLRARDYVEEQLMRHVERRAAALRWALLISATGVLIATVLWHYAALDELRAAMQTWHAAV